MNYEENGITLGQLFLVVKKSFKRAIIYVLISILVASTFLLTVRTFTKTSSYSANVTISSKNDDSLLTTFNANKSLAVSNALDELGFSQEIKTDLVKNTTITAKIPKDVKDDNYIPNVFEITVKPDKDFGLSNKQYVSLTDKIANEYVNVFSTVSFPTVISTYQRTGVGDTYEYIRYADGIYSNIYAAVSSINLFIANSGIDKSSSELMEMNILLAELNDLLNYAEQIKQFIIANTIEINSGAINNYIAVEKQNAQAENEKYNKLVVTAQAALDSYSSVIQNITTSTNSAGNIYQLNDEGFIKLTKELMYYQQLEAEATEKAGKITAYEGITKNQCTEEAKSSVKEQFSAITGELDKLLEKYNSIEVNYNSNQNLTSIADVTMPASQVNESIVSILILAIIDVLVAMIAYVVAFSKTFSIMKKQNAFDSTKEI